MEVLNEHEGRGPGRKNNLKTITGENIINIISPKIYNDLDQDAIIFNNIERDIENTQDQKELARLKRLLRIHNMPDLTNISNHPIHQITKKIADLDLYKYFDRTFGPEVVNIRETFDKFNFPKDHVARNKSDTYYIQGEDHNEESLILRPHISVMRNTYLNNPEVIKKLNEKDEIGTLSWGKVYRVDDVDATHHQVFHQIDGFKIVKKDKHLITKQDLKNILTKNVQAIFGENIQYRIRDDHFPYTENSMEIDVFYNGERLEILGAGTVHPDVLGAFGIDPQQYNGRAFGIGIERIVMPIKQISDIRIFRSEDERITNQWGDLYKKYQEVSKFPLSTRDFSIIIPKTYNEREITELMRDYGKELIENIEKIDDRDGKGKFGSDHKSISLRITFRSIDKTLTNDEINKIYFNIRSGLHKELGLEVR